MSTRQIYAVENKMNFKDLAEDQKREVAKLMFQPLNSPDDLKDWVMFYLGLDMPIGIVDPDSTSSPIDAMWEIYNAVKNNDEDAKSKFIMLSCRSGYKTLSSSILETLLMVHFKITIGHMASIKEQSSIAIGYINYFFLKLEPLLTVAGWINKSQNKSQIEFQTPEGESVYIKVVVCTAAGANSLHTNLFFIDEVDLINNILAYEESSKIPVYSKGRYPITVRLSTRKFAFGLMAKAVEDAEVKNHKLLRWNIIDIAEKCPTDRHLPDMPKVDRYVAKGLPLRQISPEEYDVLVDIEKKKWELLKDVHAGCASCKLLPVCKTRLADRPDNHVGGLYRPIKSIIGDFEDGTNDMNEAQLMCWRPSAKGLVYPRFESSKEKGNLITPEQAYETIVGVKKEKANELDLLLAMKNAGVRFIAGVDWGYTHDFVIVIFAMLASGEVWVMDCFSQAGLEFVDQLEVAKGYRDKYGPEKWFCDQAMPSSCVSFTKNGMRSPKFTKDVMGGIEALRSKIVDAFGRRWLKVLHTDANQKVVNTFIKHYFQLDSQGNPTMSPDDTPGIADQADAMRYIAQNMFPVKGTQKPLAVWPEKEGDKPKDTASETLMKEELARLTAGSGSAVNTINSGKKGGFYWSM